jgi:hypothetical protein
MAKQPNIPDTILKQFNKVQFKPGEIVFFTWLGTKKYGYVKAIKETNWGIQYTVEANGTKYPCGIQIKGYKTTYTTGCIYADETRSYGVEELERRSQTGHFSTYSEVIREPGRTETKSGSSNRSSGSVPNPPNRKTKNRKSNVSTSDANIDSNNGVQSNNTKKRKDSKLDSAIQRQRDFLNGFVKKD